MPSGSPGAGSASPRFRGSAPPWARLEPRGAAARAGGRHGPVPGRDYPLDGISDAALGARFEVEGFEALQAAVERKQGAIVVGSHLGGHIAGLHALFRLGVPLRLLVQRPGHVSAALNRSVRPDRRPVSAVGVLRPPRAVAGRGGRADPPRRSALRDGLAVYLTADIPWDGPNSRPGRLLGQTHRFLSVWADLAVQTRVPVFLVFCNHRGGGRYALTIDPPWTLGRGDEPAAVVRYFDRLERAIAADPADAVAHLLWPCYGPPHATPPPRTAGPPRRRGAASLNDPILPGKGWQRPTNHKLSRVARSVRIVLGPVINSQEDELLWQPK